MKPASLFGAAVVLAGTMPFSSIALPQTAAPVPTPAPAIISPASVSVATSHANALPPMSFYASIAPDELLSRVKTAAAFAHVEKDLAGSPIQLRVTHSLQPTAGGQAAGLLSAIWAGGTLGLLPVVTNNNLVVTYQVSVNGREIARYDFSRSFTRAINIWAAQNDPTYGLGAEGLEWVKGTVAEFTTKAAQDANLLALTQEYALYFGKDAT